MKDSTPPPTFFERPIRGLFNSRSALIFWDISHIPEDTFSDFFSEIGEKKELVPLQLSYTTSSMLIASNLSL